MEGFEGVVEEEGELVERGAGGGVEGGGQGVQGGEVGEGFVE